MICHHCERNLCLVSLHKEALTSKLSILSSTMSSSHKRNHFYYSFAHAEYGLMGAKNHVKMPERIVSYISSICPSDDGMYTGYRDADGCVDASDHDLGKNGVGNVRDGHRDALNASFEEVQAKANPVYIAFDRGEC